MTETRETKLTDSEAKMLRERCFKHGLLKRPDFSDAWPDPAAMAFGSELLLAAKDRLALIAYAQIGATRNEIGDAIRKADLGDLFEEK